MEETEMKGIEIPFGAHDSELKGWEYTIPEGMEAEIKGVKIVVRKKESEDERIRKEIVDYFKKECEYLLNDFRDKEDEKQLSFYNKAIAWLEKQKEHQFCSDAPNESSWSGIISSSDKDKNLDEIAQDYVDGVKEYNPEPTWNLMQTAVCYGYHYREQKEQKPEDRFEEAREKYQVEWSEEDEKMRVNILNALTPQLVYSVGKGTCTGTSTYKYDDEIKWLKSLRPSWKPSEEQMDALSKARHFKPYNCDILESLYEQLQNLM